MGRQPNKFDGGNDDYKERRKRNNEAVRKSREKSKKKTTETLDRVNQLKKENFELESQIKLFKEELSRLKEVFLTMAGSTNVNNIGVNFDELLNDSDEECTNS